MRALILAAGFGNRMKPLTLKNHKTLLEINGQTIIDRIIRGLEKNGIHEISIVTGYMAEKLKSYLISNYTQVNFQFIHNSRYRETNNIYSMALAFEKINFDEDIIFIESDLIYESKVIERAINSKYDNVALVCRYRSGLDGTVVKIEDNQIVDVIPPYKQSQKFDFSDKYKTLNIYKFSGDFCNKEFRKLLNFYASNFDENCYYELVLGMLIYMQREAIHCEIIKDEKWSEVDDPNDLRIAEYTFNDKKKIEILDSSHGGYWNYDVLDFCFIRNMYFPTPSMISEIRSNLDSLIFNYGSKQDILNEKLSYVLECNVDNLITLNGAAQIFPILAKMFEGKKILIPNPTFGEYSRLFKNNIMYQDKGVVDWDNFNLNLPDVDMVVFVNPNNPTGTCISTKKIVNIIESNPETIFLIDESFIDFTDEPSIIRFLEKKSLDNVIVITSMSKSYGCPGIRLGFVYTTNKKIKKNISEQIPVWNNNSISEFFLESILKNKPALSKSFLKTKKDRDKMIRELQEKFYINWVYPSQGNFVLVKLEDASFSASKVQKILIDKYGIYIKDISSKFNDQSSYCRFSVRTPEENCRLIVAIDNIFSITT